VGGAGEWSRRLFYAARGGTAYLLTTSIVGLAMMNPFTGRSGVNEITPSQEWSVILMCPGPTDPRPSVASRASHWPETKTSVHMWTASPGLPSRLSTYTSPIAVRDGIFSARHMAAVSIAYSVQSPVRVFATWSAGAIASVKFATIMNPLTNRSMAWAFFHGSV